MLKYRRLREFVMRLAMPLLLGMVAVVTTTQVCARETPIAAEINRRWDRANTLYDRSDYNAALVEYLEVLKHKPLPVVWYNLGRTEEKLGHYVEALDWLEKCLLDPGTLDETRREFTRKLVDDLKARIGTLQVTTNITGATVEVDSREIGKGPQKVRVTSGVHFVSVDAPGYAGQRKEVKIAGGIEESVHFELVPTTIATARLTISSDLPDADVFVDGKLVGKTPILGSIKVEAIEHKIEVSRAGYKSFERAMKFTEGDTLPLAVKLEEDVSWIAANGGYLQLDLSEEHVIVNVSGISRGEYRGSLRLAPGKHRLRLERAGFATVEREAMVVAGKTTREKVVFEPNPDTLVKIREEYATRRKWGIAATATGASLVVVGTWVAMGFLVEAEKVDSDRVTDHPNRGIAPTYRGIGAAGVFGALIGVGALSTGIWLLNSSSEPLRHRHGLTRDSVAKFWILPTIGIDEFGMRLEGRF